MYEIVKNHEKTQNEKNSLELPATYKTKRFTEKLNCV